MKSKNVRALRQDCIENGILPDYSEMELYLIAPNIDNKTINPFEEYNTKNYLTKCILIGHSLNKSYQTSMKNVFESIQENNDDIKLTFSKAPVKLEARSRVKAQTDYGRTNIMNNY